MSRDLGTSDLHNRVALVTGGSRGIGEAIALTLGEAGAAVAVNYRARSEEADAVAEAIRKGRGRAAAVRADVSVSTAVHDMIHDIEPRLGPIEILVNNTGTAVARGLDDITEEDFNRAIAVNLKSAFSRFSRSRATYASTQGTPAPARSRSRGRQSRTLE
jgi:3-oxoacyl-[acyl-carrier protein] reductase